MSEAKLTPRKHQRKRLPLLGAAGLSLSLSSGASATMGVTSADIVTCSTALNHEQPLREEEITDINLSTFHISNGEGMPRLRARVAGCGACVGCASGSYSNQPAYNGPASSPSPSTRQPTHPYVHTLKRPPAPKNQDQSASRATPHETDLPTSNQNTIRQLLPNVDGLVGNQSAGQQSQPQVATPVTNSAN
jgi:hypothetical protein